MNIEIEQNKRLFKPEWIDSFSDFKDDSNTQNSGELASKRIELGGALRQ